MGRASALPYFYTVAEVNYLSVVFTCSFLFKSFKFRLSLGL